MMRIHVHFFSTIRARIGEKNITIELEPGSRVADLKEQIASRYPAAAPTIAGMNSAVNHVFADDNALLTDEAEVAFFPYVTGG